MIELYICYNFSSNGKNKLARNILKVSIKGSNTYILIITTFCIPTPTLILGLLDIYTDINL